MSGMVWLGILVILLIIEIITLGLTTIWFAGGALIAFIAYLLGATLPVQVALFIVVSILLLVATRPLAVKFINRDRVKTNAESLVGAAGIVTKEIDNLKATGTVNVHGQEWTARSVDNSRISVDKIVIIQEIQGVKLIVKEKEEKED